MTLTTQHLVLSIPNTQHPTPNTQHPTPNTQHLTANSKLLVSCYYWSISG
ncbi:MAG: hypothetical protein KME29_13410 [Calothrix sp. FI2-JRJ7]|nr:hypothetical protein [Calothrix sp. FI2-JRJ7]